MSTPVSKPPEGVTTVSTDIPVNLHSRIAEAAAWRGMTVSRFVAEAAAREAEKVIEKERFIQLSREDSQLVMSLLENPPRANAALHTASELHKRLIDG